MTTNADELTPDQIAGMTIEQLSEMAGEIADSDDESVNDASQTSADDDANQGDNNAAGETPAGVATKAGNKIIPYEVLDQTRKKVYELEDKTAQLEREKAEAQAKASELEQKLQNVTSANVGDIELMTDEEIEAIAEDMPELAKTITALQNQAKSLAAKLSTQEASQKKTEGELVAQTVQEAIDSVPKLAFIQSSNPRLFGIATDIDKEMRQDPAMQGLSMAERFAKVIEKLEAEIGFEIKLEGKPKASEKPPILSLSDMPGGATPATDEAQALIDRPATELAAKFHSMTSDQITKFIDKIQI